MRDESTVEERREQEIVRDRRRAERHRVELDTPVDLTRRQVEPNELARAGGELDLEHRSVQIRGLFRQPWEVHDGRIDLAVVDGEVRLDTAVGAGEDLERWLEVERAGELLAAVVVVAVVGSDRRLPDSSSVSGSTAMT